MKGKDLRLVFMGTPDFAVESLKGLFNNGYNIVGVVTAPDKPAGRGRQISESAVKKFAISKGLNVMQPEKLKSPEFLNELNSLNADLQIVVAFRMLPEEVWNMPPLGTFNLHASLLPKYRGAAPLNWAIINGEKETGVTTFFLKHEIDTGNIIFQEKIEIDDDDNVEELHDKSMLVGANLVVKTVNAIAKGSLLLIDQDKLIKEGLLPCAAPKILKEDCLIDWNNDPSTVRNFIRGLSPYPGAWTKVYDLNSGNEYHLKIFDVEIEQSEKEIEPGKFFSDGKKYIKFSCKNGFIDILELQFPGKKRMKTSEFLRGYSVENLN